MKSVSGTQWVLALPDSFALNAALRGLSLIQETLQKAAGSHVMVQLVQEASSAQDNDGGVLRAEEEREREALQDPSVQKVIQTFGGKVRASEDDRGEG